MKVSWNVEFGINLDWYDTSLMGLAIRNYNCASI